MAGNIGLPKCEANYSPLTPITFLQRAAAVFPDRESVIYGRRRFTWAETHQRCLRLASALKSHSISPGDTVSVVAPNVPAMYELHFGVPMVGAVLNTINIRLDARTVAVILGHVEAKVVFVDDEFLPLIRDALSKLHSSAPKPFLIHIKNVGWEMATRPTNDFGSGLEYEEFVASGDSSFAVCWPKDEWDAITINYTSGTTAAPKGVVYHHRGAYINSLAAVMDWGMPAGAVYLCSVPMFHCNGWCFTWGLAAQGGTSILIRNVTVRNIFDALVEHKVTHMGGAPTILSLIANAKDDERRPVPQKLQIWTGGAPPPAAVLAKLESLGFTVGHGYGLTETYGPAVSCLWKEEWDELPLEQRAKLKARQGVGHLALSGVDVFDPKSMTRVAKDGLTMGEVMVKGHTVMKGYLKDPQATQEAFRGGWFHTGDEGVMHPDGYLQLKDRSKDIIISGGENISSLEVESILYQHPQILEAAVVARPDEFWGETPCAFVMVTESADCADLSEKNIIDFCRQRLPHFMAPRSIVFEDLPKTSTGKVQKHVLRERAKALGPLARAPNQTSTIKSNL